MNAIGKSYLACSIAAVLGTGTASALPPTTTPAYTIYAGGGSAEPQPFQVAVCKLLTNVDSYTDATGGAESGDYKILFGSASADIGTGATKIPSGSAVLVLYKFNGGSYVNGAVPQAASGSNLTYPATSVALAATATGVTLQSACTNTAKNGAPTYSYTTSASTATTSQLPAFGITDLEPSAFTGYNLPTTQTPVNPANIVTAHIYDLVEGVAVTDTLFKVKSRWTSLEIAQVLSGSVSDWSQLSGDSGAPLTAGPVVLIDRNVGSGTKAAGSAFFLGYPGLSGAGLAGTPQSVSGLVGGTSGCSATYSCYVPTASATFSTTYGGYQDIQDGNSTAVVNDLSKANDASMYAIGILSADNAPYATQNSGHNEFDFVKINGAAMDLSTSTDDINGTSSTAYDNVITGGYGFFYQVAFNTRPSFLAGTSPAAEFAAAMKTQLSADALAGAFSNAHFPLAAPGIVIDAANDTASHTTGVTIASRGGNSTAPLQLIKKGVTITPASDPL